YRRARHTAALIAEVLGFTGTIAIEPDLHERSIGVLAGEPYRSTREDARYDPERFWDWRPEGGESLEDVRIRASAVIERLATAHRGEDVVVVSHCGVMLALCAHIEGSWRTAVAGNCELLVVEHDGRLPPAVGATFRCVIEEREEPAGAPLGLVTGAG